MLVSDETLAGSLAEILVVLVLEAVETDRVGVVAVAIQLGFPIEPGVGEDGGTLLHNAALQRRRRDGPGAARPRGGLPVRGLSRGPIRRRRSQS